ncbi:MAG TPA: manganese transporter, partial [Methylomirabilota bacterium]|nr:manganese transporter [Methylomirabilota bacterium]
KLFYGMYAAMVVIAAAIVLIPHAPLGLITTAVQALAGILLPSTTVFAVLLCNDRAVLGPWINRPWLNVLAAIIVGTLLLLSLILVISTVVPSVDVTVLLKLLAPLILIVIAVGGVAMWWGSRTAQPIPPASRSEREGWRMPALALLERPRSSLLRRIAMLLLGSYVAFAVILLAVKAVQIAIGHH